MITPPVGWPIQYYRHADKTQPLPAQVAQATTEGGWPILCVVYSFPGGGREVLSMRGVRHVDDPLFNERPHFKNQYGAWGYIPGFPMPVEEKTQPKAQKKTQELAKV